jgi:exonuclease SbcC
MRSDKLKLKGLTRFDAPVELDFTTLPPGIIAIVGPNGEGKSTLMEAMLAGFYRRMMRGDLFDCVTARDAYIEVEAAFDGRGSYRARVNLDHVARKSDAVLEHLPLGGGRVLLNDGKASTFDQVVAREFPLFELLLCSAYAAQNQQGSFRTLDRKGKREVFGSLLGLAGLARHAETSREAARAVDRRRSEIQMLVDQIAVETRPERWAALQQDQDHITARTAEVSRAFEAVRAQVMDLERDRDTAAVGAAAYRKAKDVLADAERRKARVIQDLRDVETEAATIARTLERRTHDVEAALTRVIDRESITLGTLPSATAVEARRQQRIADIAARLELATADRKTRIANNEQLLTQADEVRAAVDQVKALREQQHVADAMLEAAIAAEAAARAAVGAVVLERTGLSSAIDERTRVLATSALLDRVPCGGLAPYDGCELLQTARAAKGRLPDLDEKVERHATLGTTLVALTDAHNAAITEVHTARQSKLSLGAQLHPGLLKTADLAPTLAAAQQRIDDLQREIVRLTEESLRDCEAAQATADETNDQRDREIEASADRVKVARAQADRDVQAIAKETRSSAASMDAKRQPLDAALAAIATEVTVAEGLARDSAAAQDALATLEAELTAARERRATEMAAAARLVAELQAHMRRVAEFQQRVNERDRLAGVVRSLDTDLVDWQALARVFGPDGLPVLEIDQAGPGVSAIANDLLQACFGGRFTVELVTQEPKADGKGFKEVFELRVFDGARGGEPRDLALVSGGEGVLIEEALRSAIALYMNQRNVLPIRTVFRDETTGSLDPENALRYVPMLRRVRERGGIHHLLFITHNPDVAALADAQIVVAGGTARIVLPPFGRSEAA